jgi:hypothetical protein
MGRSIVGYDWSAGAQSTTKSISDSDHSVKGEGDPGEVRIVVKVEAYRVRLPDRDSLRRRDKYRRPGPP